LNNDWDRIGMVDKQEIARSFGQSALNYHANATLQQDCAARLLEIVEPWIPDLPSGAVLEVGCGTGFLTYGLGDRFPDRAVLATDLSAEMMQFCQSHLPHDKNISFQPMDGENITGKYALILSSFAIQWFEQPTETLQHWLKHLEPKGLIGLAFPTCDSFPEWRGVCDRLQIPFTANALPDVHKLLQDLSPEIRVFYSKEMILTTSHRNAADFFRSLKAIGAGMNTSGQTLTPTQMKKLIQTWDKQVQNSGCVVHHHVAFLILGRSESKNTSPLSI
jgi:malonyl-CoA O-methyltransferase